MEDKNVNSGLISNFYNKLDSGELPKIFALTLPIALIQKTLFANGEEFFKERFSLMTSEIDVLASLYTHSGVLSPTQLYDLTIFSSGGMTKLLKRLEDRGYIYRKQDEKDKRCMLVYITKKGEEVTKEALFEVSKECQRYFEVLDSKEQTIFEALLKKVLTNLNNIK